MFLQYTTYKNKMEEILEKKKNYFAISQSTVYCVSHVHVMLCNTVKPLKHTF